MVQDLHSYDERGDKNCIIVEYEEVYEQSKKWTSKSGIIRKVNPR